MISFPVLQLNKSNNFVLQRQTAVTIKQKVLLPLRLYAVQLTSKLLFLSIFNI